MFERFYALCRQLVLVIVSNSNIMYNCVFEGNHFTMLMICLYWIILAVGAYSSGYVKSETYTSMKREMDILQHKEVQSTTQNYYSETMVALFRQLPCNTPLFMPTKSVYIALDFCDALKSNPEIKELHQTKGLSISAFCDIVQCEPLTQMSSLYARYLPEYAINWNDTLPCSKYNISVVRENNRDVIDTITQSSCKPWNIRHLFRAAAHEIPSVISIQFLGVPNPDLLIDDLLYFPSLREIILESVPLASEALENELLCYSPLLKLFSLINSLGYLQKFPSHIFNCSQELPLKTIMLYTHNIAYLPARAFRSAANSLKYAELVDIGLMTIDKDAFAGVMTLEVLNMVLNKITTPLYSIIPPSAQLHVLVIAEYDINIVSLNTLEIKEQKHLNVIKCDYDNISNLTGMFCSNEHKSKLELVTLEGNALLQLTPPLLDNCVSLKYLSFSNNMLSHLDSSLFENNVSLVGLDLSRNMLSDNVSWSGLLAQQNELQHLNLSSNILMSWTQNIDAVWQLKQLDISWNQISTVAPTAFVNLSRLEVLSLEGNFLHKSGVICVLPFIREIHLAENVLNSVACISNISNVLLTDVSSNNISDLVIGTRKSCPSQCQDITLHAENN